MHTTQFLLGVLHGSFAQNTVRKNQIRTEQFRNLISAIIHLNEMYFINQNNQGYRITLQFLQRN